DGAGVPQPNAFSDSSQLPRHRGRLRPDCHVRPAPRSLRSPAMFIEKRPEKIDRSRRSFLKAIGAGAVTLPFFRLLSSSISEAQTATSPLRVLFIHSPLGTSFKYWRPQIPGTSSPVTGSTTSFNLNFT